MGADMPAVAIDTEWGTAWLLHERGRVVGTLLPGAPTPGDAADDDPPAGAAAVAAALARYYRTGRDLPDGTRFVDGPPFRRAVYAAVCAIPRGATRTYAEVARSVGHPGAARAVGAAMAANRFAPLIPCHRVVGSDGTLRGYAGGTTLKRALLAREAS